MSDTHSSPHIQSQSKDASNPGFVDPQETSVFAGITGYAPQYSVPKVTSSEQRQFNEPSPAAVVNHYQRFDLVEEDESEKSYPSHFKQSEPVSEAAEITPEINSAYTLKTRSEKKVQAEVSAAADKIGELANQPVFEKSLNEDVPTAQFAAGNFENTVQLLPIHKIFPNPFQPRKIFNQEALQELAASIQEHGLIQPIVVNSVGDHYEILVGERRFRAVQLTGIKEIPAVVKATMHDQARLEIALIENIQRQELNPIEEALAYDRLIKAFDLTQQEVADKVGKSRPAVGNTLRLLQLPPEIQRGVVEEKITEGHARALLGLPDLDSQLELYHYLLKHNLNVRQVEHRIKEWNAKKSNTLTPPDPKLQVMERELRGTLGAQVKIQRLGKGGKIMIEFFSDEELQDLITKMAHEASQSNSISSTERLTDNTEQAMSAAQAEPIKPKEAFPRFSLDDLDSEEPYLTV